jgi:hypothetical protein
MPTTREILSKCVMKKEWIDRFLDDTADNWARFDSELGYTLRDTVLRDGVDQAHSIYSYEPSGERKAIQYAHTASRINTYGNSFTQCQQVSDGETWQEILAAHLGEPVRNFGVGGYGVYQAYRRLLRHEGGDQSVPYLLFNVWRDDHYRSIYPCRWIHINCFREKFGSDAWPLTMMHANPWEHLVFHPQDGSFEEKPNPCPTPESLYQLCEADFIHDTFVNNFDTQCFAATQGAGDVRTQVIQEVAGALDIPTDWSSPQTTAQTCERVLTACALRSTMWVLDRLKQYTKQYGKKLMVLLSYADVDTADACRGVDRFDQPLMTYLETSGLPFVDGYDKHKEDFAAFKCTPDEYVKRFYIGHYNPAGNFFFAHAIKNEVVDWLDPKPPTYRSGGLSISDVAATLA